MELGRGLDDESLRRGAAYGTAVGATAIVAGLTKITVRRDRPYTYNRHPDVVAYTAAAHGNDHSFFSGHTSLSFAAMTSGAMLHSATSASDQTRLVLWGGAGAIAAATGVLRIRAGQHFPTDVAVGAVVGIGLGIGLTAAVEPATELRATDVGMLAAGIVVGTLAAAVVPMRKDVRVPLGLRSLAVVPTVAPGQAVLSIIATK
jgi:membrane-associated phospholipid phosphatase